MKDEGLPLSIIKGCVPVDGDTYDVPAIIETAETRWRVYGQPRAKFGHREKFGNDPAKHPGAVKSPMVGTFYRSASPGASSFVEIGSVVKQGDTVCIIEAMKILNEIEADKAGTITQILGQNGQAVEYGQPLFMIE